MFRILFILLSLVIYQAAMAGTSDYFYSGRFLNFYRVLGVSPSASEEEIKRAYRKLSLATHPDRVGEQGVERQKLLNRAYQVLKNPSSRKQYDALYPRFVKTSSPKANPPATSRPPTSEPPKDSTQKTPEAPASSQRVKPMSAEEIASRIADAHSLPLEERQKIIQELMPQIDALSPELQAELGQMIRVRVQAKKAYSPEADQCSRFYTSI